MELKERMDLLLSAGVLSQKNYENVEKVIAYFKQQHGIELTEENAAAFITHLCMALERKDQNQKIAPMDESLLTDIKQENCFPQAYSYCKDVCSLLPQIDEEESNYLCLHIASFLL